MSNLGYFRKHHFLSKTCGGYLLCNVLNYLGYSLFQHLVTLNSCVGPAKQKIMEPFEQVRLRTDTTVPFDVGCCHVQSE